MDLTIIERPDQRPSVTRLRVPRLPEGC
jgi:hypothetical protein